MSPKRTKAKKKKKKKKNFVELSLKSFFFWSLGLFFLTVWIFVLGVLVGRGLLSYGDMKDQFDRVQGAVGRKDLSGLDLIEEPEEDPKFEFYERLSTKKEEAAKKGQPSKKKAVGQIRPAKRLEIDKFLTKKDEISKGKQLDIKKSRVQLDQDKEVSPLKTGEGYTVQVASFGKRNGAVKITEQLKNRGHPAYFLKVNIEGKVRYRVMCGSFKDRKEADNYQKLLAGQEKFPGCFVTRVE